VRTTFLVSLALTVAISGTAAQSAPRAERPSGRIAVSAGPLEPGRSNVYVVEADGTGLRQLTHVGINFDPSLSPDGKHVAFRGNRNGNEDVYVVNVDGTGERRLTHDRGADYSPAWSPDGTKIAFASTRAGLPRIYVMNADGSRQRRVTRRATGEYPSWSPDGRRIVFATNPTVT
jgi:TolB protein